ncbi:uncharacterized protein LOC111296198 isoform X2 [Durio zibethinus]|uniref:Uncharacterized protein LOC111296198 isoform X2 n=1 Tax=Durio zibethinus TaxID=66656 RepID=A0A6P5Z195_DURZI|nr:uncharacterized protein LOC111296198 isoform X2 [Durio zibethinus]
MSRVCEESGPPVTWIFVWCLSFLHSWKLQNVRDNVNGKKLVLFNVQVFTYLQLLFCTSISVISVQLELNEGLEASPMLKQGVKMDDGRKRYVQGLQITICGRLTQVRDQFKLQRPSFYKSK